MMRVMLSIFSEACAEQFSSLNAGVLIWRKTIFQSGNSHFAISLDYSVIISL